MQTRRFETFELPGEQLVPGKPWIRLHGKQVLRYVRPEREWDELTTARNLAEFIDSNLLENTLEKGCHKLQAHLDVLRECAVDVVQTECEIDKVPINYGLQKGVAFGAQLGMILRTPLLEGTLLDVSLRRPRSEIDQQSQEVVEDLTEGLADYVYECQGQELLADIFKRYQYMLHGQVPVATLIDVEPAFRPADDMQIHQSLAQIEQMGYGIAFDMSLTR